MAKSNPEKLHEIVHTLTNHCIKVNNTLSMSRFQHAAAAGSMNNHAAVAAREPYHGSKMSSRFAQHRQKHVRSSSSSLVDRTLCRTSTCCTSSRQLGTLRLMCCVSVLQAQAAPPLDQYNELLRICEMHSDLASVHKVSSCGYALEQQLPGAGPAHPLRTVAHGAQA